MKRSWLPPSALIPAALGTAAAAGILARSAYERNHLTVTREEIVSERLPEAFDGFRIAFLSDLHGNGFGDDRCSALAGAVRDAHPDLILCGGDSLIVKKGKTSRISVAAALWEQLAQLRVPMYHGLGNHEIRMRDEDGYGDLWEAYGQLCRDHGMELLDNDTVKLTKEGRSVYIAALTVPKELYRSFGKAPMPDGYVGGALGPCRGFTVLMAHSPLYFDEYAAWGADLCLTGHFHGGTVRVPGLGGLMTPNYMFFPQYDRGRYEKNGSVMLLSAGLGTHSIDLRLNDPPELIVITLRHSDGPAGGTR